MNHRMAFLLMPVLWLAWGFSYPVTAIMFRELDVWTSRLIIVLLGGGVMLLVAGVRGIRLAVPRAQWLNLFVAALCNISIFQICVSYGVYLASPGRTAVIIYTMPLWAMLFARIMLGERFTRSRVSALVCGLAGMVLLMSQDMSHLRNAPLGIGLTFVAAISFGFGTVWLKRCRWDMNVTTVGCWQLFIGAIPIFAIWPAFAPEMPFERAGPASWLAIVYLGVVANGLAYLAWFRIVTMLPATTSGISSMAVPIVGIFGSAVFVGEAVGWREICALVLICAALWLILFRTPLPRPDEAG